MFVCSLHLKHLIWKNNKNCVKHGHDDFCVCLFCICKAQLDSKFNKRDSENGIDVIDNWQQNWTMKTFCFDCISAFHRFSFIKYTNLFRLLLALLFACLYFTHYIVSSNTMNTIPPHSLQLTSPIAQPRRNCFLLFRIVIYVCWRLCLVYFIFGCANSEGEPVELYAEEFDVFSSWWTNNRIHTHIPNANMNEKEESIIANGKIWSDFQNGKYHVF